MYPAVTNAQPKENYHLLLTFENGEKRIFDMKPYLEIGIFQFLKNQKVFNSVRVVFDSIEWVNEADFDPEILYQKGIRVNGK